MMMRVLNGEQDNPFATRFVDPAKHHFLFRLPNTAEAVFKRWQKEAYNGQIVGPHGSGKSTLLHTLLAWADDHHIVYKAFFLNRDTRRLPAAWQQGLAPTFMAIDGAEQLRWWHWYHVKFYARRHKLGLIVTSHRSLGLPCLLRTEAASPETVQHVADSLLPPDAPALSHSMATTLVRKYHGNLRLILFDLYHQWETEHRQS